MGNSQEQGKGPDIRSFIGSQINRFRQTAEARILNKRPMTSLPEIDRGKVNKTGSPDLDDFVVLYVLWQLGDLERYGEPDWYEMARRRFGNNRVESLQLFTWMGRNPEAIATYLENTCDVPACKTDYTGPFLIKARRKELRPIPIPFE